MPSKLGEAVLVLKANAKGLKSGLDKASKATGSAVKGMQAKFQGFANKIPVVGGALAGLATPAGLATAAIGLTVGVLTKMVTKTLDLGRSLGTARETLGVSAEAIQIYRRAIEETNGTASSFDQSVLRLTRSIGEAGTGNKQYQEDFERIGLSYEDLAEMSPEDALKAVTGAINEQLSPADGAAVKAALLGRGYAGMGGFANLTTAEIEELTSSVADSAVVMGGDAVDNVDEYDATMREMRDTFGKVAITVGTKLIPKITQLVQSFMSIVEALWPVIDIMLTPLKHSFTVIFGAVDVLSKLLKGDFAGAWNAVLDTAIGVMGNLVQVYNSTIAKIPGVAEIDMERVKTAILSVGSATSEELEPALVEATESTEKLTTATNDLAEAASTTAERVAAWKEAQEEANRAGADMEAQVRGQVIPSLAELEEQLNTAAEAEREMAAATVQSAADQLAASAEVDALRQSFFLEQIRRQGETRRVARETADAIVEAAAKAADDTQRETARMNASWDTYLVNQDAVVAAMLSASINFEDVVDGLAKSFGISTVDMATKAKEMGVSYNDTMALMEAFGREKIAAIIKQMQAAAEAAGAAKEAIDRISDAAQAEMNNTTGIPLNVLDALAAQAGPDTTWHETPAVVGGDIAFVPKFDGRGNVVNRDEDPDYVPSTAHGGITNGPQIRRVGEGGEREAIIPLSKLPDMMSRMMGSGTGGRQPITIMGDVYGWDDFVDKVGEAGVEIEERGG